jgi:lysophospholipase L1-like esterase
MQLVTLTIGGNDIAYVRNLMSYGCQLRTQWYWKFLQALTGCHAMPDAEVQARLQALPERFDRIAAEVHRRSPQARLVLLTYQSVLPASGSCARLGLNDEQADHMRAVAGQLAEITRAAAARNGALLFDAAAATAAHDACAVDPWMGDQQAAAALHPNLAGMTALAQGLDQLLGPVARPGGT